MEDFGWHCENEEGTETVSMADGHGSSFCRTENRFHGGFEAATEAACHVAAHFQCPQEDMPMPGLGDTTINFFSSMMVKAFRSAHESVLATYKATMPEADYGTTLTTCHFRQDADGVPVVVVGYVGDTELRLFRLRSHDDRQMFETTITTPHTVDNADEVKRLRRVGTGVSHKSPKHFMSARDSTTARLIAVSRAVGHRKLQNAGIIPVPDVKMVRCRKGDVLILATDGFWDHWNFEDTRCKWALASALREDNLDAAAETLLRMVKPHGTGGQRHRDAGRRGIKKTAFIVYFLKKGFRTEVFSDHGFCERCCAFSLFSCRSCRVALGRGHGILQETKESADSWWRSSGQVSMAFSCTKGT